MPQGSSSNRSRTLVFQDDAHAESSKPHKDDDLETQFSDIPDSVLSQTLFP
jgi:hypothetical protein